ncbi:perosamine synthetase [Methylogaea oryzae]|uniref:GDP-perosamine synthase n=2 Tax=Methylogaea oryzae TaxID=1295382 RepID=A0A8D5AHH1_9GAMM|nr:perosamine synthetase [Methylogaea oryzae]
MAEAALEAKILAALRTALPETPHPVALHEPRFAGREWEYVKECLDTGWVSSVGKFVDRFEADLAAYMGVKHAVATVNGTAALHVCLLLAGIAADDEVLVPSLTFIATANAVAYCGATPHFVDSDEASLGVAPAKLADYLAGIAEVTAQGCRNRLTGRPIKALLVMHAFGHPADLDGLAELCERYRLTLIEDAAESLGSYYRGRHTGQWGLLSAVSFNGNKIATTGGGGALLTNDSALAKRAKHLTTTAKLPHAWEFVHDEVGYNYRLPNLNAALGCAQLEQMEGFLAAKRRLAERYAEAFAGLAGARFFTEQAHARSNYWLNVLLLDPAQAASRDTVLQATHDAGFLTRPIWTPMHRLSMYQNCPRMDLVVTEDLHRRVVCLPSSVVLG